MLNDIKMIYVARCNFHNPNYCHASTTCRDNAQERTHQQPQKRFWSGIDVNYATCFWAGIRSPNFLARKLSSGNPSNNGTVPWNPAGPAQEPPPVLLKKWPFWTIGLVVSILDRRRVFCWNLPNLGTVVLWWGIWLHSFLSLTPHQAVFSFLATENEARRCRRKQNNDVHDACCDQPSDCFLFGGGGEIIKSISIHFFG